MPRNSIFTTNETNFELIALEVFRFQYEQNTVYRQYCQSLNRAMDAIDTIEKIPFLPIQFFKTHTITAGNFTPAAIFESSGTTQSINSKHLVKEFSVYEESFTTAFKQFYGNIEDWCIVALLPSYLERNNSSLVMMAENLIAQSKNDNSGFYLNNMDQLKNTLVQLEHQQQKTLLIGVTFALLDFAEAYPMKLKHTTIMETGGMKGRRKEITRFEVHSLLQQAFQLTNIHSEYGMTELLSQAYSYSNGIFNSPAWMKILIREEDDPFALHTTTSTQSMAGAVNIIDLANLYSCSFIATEDAGKLYPNGSFEILGRLDNTDIRGCSLMAL